MQSAWRLVGALVASTAFAGPASAQASLPRVSFEVNAGVQAPSRTVTSASAFVVYDEPVTVSSRETVGVGPAFDAGFRYRFAGRLAAGVSVSEFSRTGDATLTASVPSPIFYNTFTTVTLSASALRHNELGVHARLVYLVPIGHRLELAIAGGPSLFHVNHGVPSVSVRPGTSTAIASSVDQQANGLGGNARATLTYAISSRFGISFFGGYAGGSVDLASVPGLKVGGVQGGGGVRVGF